MGSSVDKSRQTTLRHTSDRSRPRKDEVLPKPETLRRRYRHAQTSEYRFLCATNEMVTGRQSKAALVPSDASSQMKQPEKQKPSLNGPPERQCCLHESTKLRNTSVSTCGSPRSIISRNKSKCQDATARSDSRHHENTSTMPEHRVKRKRNHKLKQQSAEKEESHSTLPKETSREKHRHHHHHHHHHDSDHVSRPRDLKKTKRKVSTIEMIGGDPDHGPASASASGRSARTNGLTNRSSQGQIPRRQGETRKLNPIRPTTTSDTLMNHRRAVSLDRERIRQEADKKAETQARKQPPLPILSTTTKERDSVSDRLKKRLPNELIALPKEQENLGSYRDDYSERSNDIESVKRLINRKPSAASQSGTNRMKNRNWEIDQGGKHEEVGAKRQLSQHIHKKVLVGPLHKRSLPYHRPTRHADVSRRISSLTPIESLSTSICQGLETENESTVSWIPAGRQPGKDRYQPLPSQMPHRALAKRNWSLNLPHQHVDIMPHRLRHQHPRRTPDAHLSLHQPRKPISGNHQSAQFGLTTTEKFTRDQKLLNPNAKKKEKKKSNSHSGSSADNGPSRKYKNRLGLVFHHHHHHHHHHLHPRDQAEDHHHHYGHLLKGLFHLGRKKEPAGSLGEIKGQKARDQKLRVKKEHGHLYKLVAAFFRYILHPRKAAAGRNQVARARMMVAGGQQVKKLHWWQKIYRRGGVRLANRKKPQLRLPFRVNSHKTKTVAKH